MVMEVVSLNAADVKFKIVKDRDEEMPSSIEMDVY